MLQICFILFQICMAISRHFYRRRLTASKYAVIVSYNGSGYSGLQWQSDLRIPTIEGVIWEAFYAAGLIRKSSTRNNCHALQFSRASRTDRGQVLLKLSV